MKERVYLNQLEYDVPGKLKFFGSDEAELFTMEVDESYRGVLSKNYVKNEKGGMAGFVSASIDGRFWWDTMWTRDIGVFLREMVQWGYINHACLSAERLMALVQKNREGFYTFPEYFKFGEPGSGSELDGTAAIIIGMILLWRRLPDSSAIKRRIFDFLTNSASPVNYIVNTLKELPLIPGSGEFGGGCGIGEEFYNAVQNNLIRLALIAVADMNKKAGMRDISESLLGNVKLLEENMLKYMVAPDGTWIWCISPGTLKPDEKVLNEPVNRGASFINGVLSMTADILGFELFPAVWKGADVSIRTFEKLSRDPFRKEQFLRYGIWSQFDHFFRNMVTGPSYGHGYGTQCMFLMDKLEMADKAMGYLANATFKPANGLKLNRDSDYYFYERYYSPDMIGKGKMEEGCGALNLVCVAEPLKIARLIAGIDDTSDECVKIIPRIPPSWSGFKAESWPVWTLAGTAECDIEYTKKDGKESFKLEVNNGIKLPKVEVKLSGEKRVYRDVIEINI